MHATRPTANCQPQRVQYTPTESSIVHTVPSLVKPSSSGFQPARIKTQSVLSLNSANASRELSAPAQRFQPLCVGSAFFALAVLTAGGAPLSSFVRNSRNTFVMWVVCFDSGGNSGKALRQLAIASASSPRALACSAAFANASSSRRWTSALQFGQSSSAGATTTPQFAHGAPTFAGTCELPVSIGCMAIECDRRSRRCVHREWSEHHDRHGARELPRFIQTDADDEQADDVLGALQERRSQRNAQQEHPSPDEAAQRGWGRWGAIPRMPRGNGLQQIGQTSQCDRCVGERDRQHLVTLSAQAAGGFAHGLADYVAHADGHEADLYVEQLFDRDPSDATDQRRSAPVSDSTQEARA